jgi:hypothetical protein
MSLNKIFDNPFDKNKSIQINNRFWPNEKFTNLQLLEDCEFFIDEHGINCKKTPINSLKKLFSHEIYFYKMLKRLKKIMTFNSNFGYIKLKIEIDKKFLDMINPDLNNTYFLREILKKSDFHELLRKVLKVYRSQYGYDIARVNKSIRIASPSAKNTHDLTNFGSMSEYHNDELKGTTCIIYLSEATEDSGAFTFIDGSEAIPRSNVLTAIHQTVCFDMGLDTYEKMESIPLEFRCTPLIGNFLDEAKAVVLLEKKIVLTGPAGQGILFNGQKLIHRGGKPMVGSRYALFLAPEGLVIHKFKSLISQLT